MRYNKGEWSELYAFIKLLKDGRVYAADQNSNRIDDQYLPIIKIIRSEDPEHPIDYKTGEIIKIYQDGELLTEISAENFTGNIDLLFRMIFAGSQGNGSFEIPDIEPFMDELSVTKVKANSVEKIDINIQIHDIVTGFSPTVGYSIKSDVGHPPTLLNPGKNTRVRCKISGLSDPDMEIVNAIDKNVCNAYIKQRFVTLIEKADNIEFDCIIDETYEDNLILIDSSLPRIYGEMVLQHYLHIDEGINNCEDLIDFVASKNPINYRKNSNYRVKFKKLLTASALGMTPGHVWDGVEIVTGGYIIIKRDGDVLCYHLYNRNYFEEYLLKSTRFDRPSASRYDYGYVYELEGEKYIDLNVQIRFKSL